MRRRTRSRSGPPSRCSSRTSSATTPATSCSSTPPTSCCRCPARRSCPTGSSPGKKAANRINDEFDAYVVPLANAFRPSFAAVLDRMTELIAPPPDPGRRPGRRGTGDARLRLDPARADRAIREGVRAPPSSTAARRSASAASSRPSTCGASASATSRSSAVRRCSPGAPTSGSSGRSRSSRRDARIALTVSPYVKAIGPIVTRHVEAYPNLVYIAQDLESLELLLWGGTHPDAMRRLDNPVHLAHPLIRDDRTRFFLDPYPWIEDLRTRDFSFGTRIHGTIAALLAGTPGLVIAHDARTLELARYFDIPHRTVREVGPETDAADLYAAADFTALHWGTPRAGRRSGPTSRRTAWITHSPTRAPRRRGRRARLRPPGCRRFAASVAGLAQRCPGPRATRPFRGPPGGPADQPQAQAGRAREARDAPGRLTLSGRSAPRSARPRGRRSRRGCGR